MKSVESTPAQIPDCALTDSEYAELRKLYSSPGANHGYNVYDTPAHYALQQLRLTPRTGPGQTVLSWKTTITGGAEELSFEDQFNNTVTLLRCNSDAERIEILCEGVVEIEDNGPGISQEMQETMFYPMISGRASGTGLGLSISQSIINQHHGLVECESSPGKTTFRLLLPLEQPEEQTNVGA